MRREKSIGVTEKQLWTLVSGAIPEPHWLRIENVVGTGQSDVNGCWRRLENWIELKIFRGNTIDFKKSEVAWIARRTAAGGRCWILARKKTATEDRLILYRGSDLPTLYNSGSVTIEGKKSGAYGSISQFARLSLPKPFNWELLKNTLFPVI